MSSAAAGLKADLDEKLGPARVPPGVEVEEQFENEAQQRISGELGLWIYMLTELMMFMAMLLTVLVLRVMHPAATAIVTSKLKFWIGSLNTILMIVSCFMMYVATEASRIGLRRIVVGAMLAAGVIGIAFVCLEFFEYYRDWAGGMLPYFGEPYKLGGDPSTRLYLDIYYILTIIDCFHVTVGVMLLGYMSWAAAKPEFLSRHQNRIEIVTIYWSFVVVIWILIFTGVYVLDR